MGRLISLASHILAGAASFAKSGDHARPIRLGPILTHFPLALDAENRISPTFQGVGRRASAAERQIIELTAQPGVDADHPGMAPGLDRGKIPGWDALPVSRLVAYQDGVT